MQDHTVDAKACVGEATDDQGFTDLGTFDHAVSNINCLAYYGISAGRTAETFDPKANVTRSEMALFLYATANLMGVDLMGGDMMVDYGDISELGENRQNAITALARNGIMSGRGSMAFEPGADITRAEMAVALVNLVDHVSSNLSKDDNGLFVFGENKVRPNDSFADAYASVSQPVNNAISAAYELGITSGVGDGMFGPSLSVSRAQMAVFIINALNHSNVRPAGTTAQVVTREAGAAEIIVSVRDADFAPVANMAVDAFRANAAQDDRAFKADGSCSSRTTAVDGTTKCEIDGADPVTDSLGNTGLTSLSATDIGEGLTVWIWTGDVGDKFDEMGDYLEISVDPQPKKAASATQAAISSDLGLKGAGDARYGQQVTFTIQLQDGEENSAATPDGGVKYTLRLEVRNGRVAIDSTAATISVTPGEVELAADGSGTFIVTAADLDRNNPGELTVEYVLSRTITHTSSTSTDTEVVEALLVPGTEDPTGGTAVVPATDPATYTHTKVHRGLVVFSDAKSKVTSVSVDAADHQATGSASNPVGTSATATVLDQYGRPMSGQPIVLDSDLNEATNQTRPRFTGSNGQVRIGYSYRGGAAVETVTAIWDGGDTASTQPDCFDATNNATGEDRCGTTEVFWVGPVTDANSTATTDDADDQEITSPADVLSHDADNQQIVIDGDANAADDTARAPSSMTYDSNDFYTVDSNPVTMADFSAKLDEALAAFKTASDDNNITEVEPTLSWSGYDYEDSSTSAWFQLTTNLATNDPPG
ncbi:MAG: S-layer homology domain-containing protein [Acidimicrobiaceae bacterium]|nr:S-layer homology domain-containing protein [Acidimicrobiaceae bacterium]